MKWKKIVKYFLILLVLGVILFVYLANRDMVKIYGGHTKEVDYKPYDLPSLTFAIANVHVLSPDGSKFIPNQSVHINNGLIVSIDSILDKPGDIKTIDGNDRFLIPGLIDSHVHLFKSPNDLLLYVVNGVTQIREMIGEENHLIWRKQIQEGRLGPNMYIASPRLGSFGSLEGFFMEWSQGFNNIRNSEEAEEKVKGYKAKGYDAVKIYSYLNKESYLAINKTAESLGMDVVGHIPWSLDLADIWSSNQSDISHLEEIMNALRREFGKIKGQEKADKFLEYVNQRSKEIANDLVVNDVSVTTTLWLTESFVRQKFELDNVLKKVALEYENPGISEWTKNVPEGGLGWLPEVNRYQLQEGLTEEELTEEKIFWTTYSKACQVILKNLSEGGVKIMAGTDANLPPTVPGFSLHDELVSLNQAGMSTSQVLLSATSVPAEWLKIKAGKIMKGYQANMILLDKNPLENIRNTQTINTVILNGKILDKNLINELLVSVKKANNSSRKIDISQYLNKEN